MEYQLKRISPSRNPLRLSRRRNSIAHSANPEEAESICRDILVIEPQHQRALRLLGLALTDQFSGDASDRNRETEEIFQKLSDPYERLYYTAILHERRAESGERKLRQLPVSLLPLFEHALHLYAEAEKLRPTGNDDAILRWNRCVRLLQHPYDWEGLGQEGIPFEAYDTAPPR